MQLVFFAALTFCMLATVGICTTPPPHQSPCHDFVFNVPLTSFNDSGVIQPTATYNISATYCPPTSIVPHRSHHNTIQLLIHGGTSNKFYWSALGPVDSSSGSLQYQPHNYSYIDFARREGYHVIAIDRLGCGNSSHPDPVLVRAGMQAELTATIIHQIRHQKKYPAFLLPTSGRIILVGHSYGSFIINILLDKHPEAAAAAADAVIMTGFVHVFSSAVAAVSSQQFAPASTVFPTRFPHLGPGYITLSNRTNQREWMFDKDGTFDPVMPGLLFDREDVQALGEQNSINDETSGDFLTATAVGYRGPLAMMMGQEDQPFCHGDCGTGDKSLIELSRPFFPDVGNFQGFLMKDTGHDLQYHFSAREGFRMLHEWLEDNGF